jgi:hypothetical protein
MDDDADDVADAPILEFRRGDFPSRPPMIREKERWENPNRCEHDKGVWVDRPTKEVECRACGAKLDPIEVLFLFQKYYTNIEVKLHFIRKSEERERREEGRRMARRKKKEG